MGTPTRKLVVARYLAYQLIAAVAIKNPLMKTHKKTTVAVTFDLA
jgi:hypothetical protein